jgi:hypothetical protein
VLEAHTASVEDEVERVLAFLRERRLLG